MKSFYKSFFLLLVPMALKELVAAFINLLDGVMLGGFGNDVIAAVGIANQWYFFYGVLTFGVCGGAGVFAAQYWGANNIDKVRKVFGINLMLVTLVSTAFILVSVCAPEFIIGIFRKDAAVVDYGVRYLRIACFSYFFSGATAAYDMSLCCSENANIPFIARFIGLLVNIVANWILIFGKLGFPEMGVEGAAIATIVARVSELVIILCVVYKKKLIQAVNVFEVIKIPKGMLGGYFKAALPITLNEGAWALGTITYSWVFSQISTDAMVVITIVSSIERLMLVFFHGGGNAAGILIGKLVGADEKEQAYTVSKKLCIMNMAFALCVSVVFVVIRPLVLIPYNITPEVYAQTMKILFLTAVIMNVKALTFFFIVGVFRNGGDTRRAALIDITSMWFVGVPMAIIVGICFRLPLVAIYSCMMVEEFVKLVLSIVRFTSKKWIKNLVR